MSRRVGREIALQVLFQMDLSKERLDTEQAVEHWASEFAMPTASIPFARDLVDGTIEHLAEIDSKLRFLSEDWALERMAGVDRNVLRLAAFEILYRPDIPGRVSLNEAVEVAKKFGGVDSAKFVNGILDRLAASIGKNEGKMPGAKDQPGAHTKRKAQRPKATAGLQHGHEEATADSNPALTRKEQGDAALNQPAEENPQ